MHLPSLASFACLAVLLAGCLPAEGEAGASTLRIHNDSNRPLTYTFSSGDVGVPEVLSSAVPAHETTPILRSSGCPNCADPPSQVMRTITIRLADTGATVLTLLPVKDKAWATEYGNGYDAIHTLSVTQAQVDAAR